MKSLILILVMGSLSCSKHVLQTIRVPLCIQQQIETFKSEPKGYPPQSIIQFTYHNKRVFYIPAQCCDQYSLVLDENCSVIGHPDGGIAGGGDGKPANFFKDATDSVTIWKDDR